MRNRGRPSVGSTAGEFPVQPRLRNGPVHSDRPFAHPEANGGFLLAEAAEQLEGHDVCRSWMRIPQTFQRFGELQKVQIVRRARELDVLDLLDPDMPLASAPLDGRSATGVVDEVVPNRLGRPRPEVHFIPEVDAVIEEDLDQQLMHQRRGLESVIGPLAGHGEAGKGTQCLPNSVQIPGGEVLAGLRRRAPGRVSGWDG